MATCDGTNPGGQKPDRLGWDWVLLLVFLAFILALAGVGAMEVGR